MSEQIERVVVAGPTHMGLIVQAIPRPGLSIDDAVKEWEHNLGNAVVSVEGRTITAINQVERIAYDDSAPVIGELVWQCDRCGVFASVSRAVTEHHELTCGGPPDA